MSERLLAFLDKLEYDTNTDVSMAIDAALYAMAATVKNQVLRTVFLQDFAAALGRRKILTVDTTECFMMLASEKMEKVR